MIAFEYIFAPDDRNGEPPEAPRIVRATNVDDAVQILFLRDLRIRGVPGTVRVRRHQTHDRWLVRRFLPPQ
ncbi:MAG TPA: hypothetical protein VIV57_27585 [Anaeromyxobacter sp.]